MEGLLFVLSPAASGVASPATLASPPSAALATASSDRALPGSSRALAGGVGLVAAVASQVSRPRRGMRKARLTASARQAVPTEKPMRTTVFTKAALDGVSPGDCPFTHAVLMALKLKGVDFDVVACSQTNKPPWLLQEVGGQLPCVVHQGVARVESSQILKWIEQTFPGPSLAVPEDFSQLVSRAGVFPAIADYTKNTDSSKDDELLVNLQMALTRLRMHLFSLPIDTQYAVGNSLTLADCELLAALYVLQSATAPLKGWSLNSLPESDEVRQYYGRASVLPAFTQTCYPPNVAVQGWTQARS